jgi:DNA-binding MarR family transcriptional regulator
MPAKSVQEDFFDVYTGFQCMIIAQINQFNFEGISATQYNIVDYVLRNGKTTTGQLARAFHISAPAISRQVKLLLEKKLVKQEQDRTDRRVFYISATAGGRRLVADSLRLRQTMSAEIQKVLSPKELAVFTALCKKIVTQIDL